MEVSRIAIRSDEYRVTFGECVVVWRCGVGVGVDMVLEVLVMQ